MGLLDLSSSLTRVLAPLAAGAILDGFGEAAVFYGQVLLL